MGIDFPMKFYKGNESYLYVCWLFSFIRVNAFSPLIPFAHLRVNYC